MFNKVIYNPGFTGLDEVLNVNMLGRNQWMGFDGQPITQTISIDAPIPTGGLGLSLISDKIGAQKTTSINLSYAFRIMLGADGSLSIGLRAGLLQDALDGSLYRSPDGSYESGGINHNDNSSNSEIPSFIGS